MIAALFVARGGCYFGLDGVDPWDEERDARRYPGPHSVVAHPPCARWCRLAGLVAARGGAPAGEDDGCFVSALGSVRRYGGVLEHPASSAAFRAYGLPRPLGAGWQRTLCGGWVAQVEQGQYGHRAPKLTWLYAVGVRRLPTLRRVTSGPTGRVELLGAADRDATPLGFRDLLLGMADQVAL